jgi:hypothetical protein
MHPSEYDSCAASSLRGIGKDVTAGDNLSIDTSTAVAAGFKNRRGFQTQQHCYPMPIELQRGERERHQQHQQEQQELEEQRMHLEEQQSESPTGSPVRRKKTKKKVKPSLLAIKQSRALARVEAEVIYYYLAKREEMLHTAGITQIYL